MGMGTNILIFCLLFSFGMRVYCTTGDTSCSNNSAYDDMMNKVPANIRESVSTVTGLAGLVILVGVVLFPNPYLIFAAITVFLAAFPFNVFIGGTSGLPSEISGLIGGILGLAFFLAILSWYKGGDVP
jgi:hypothetical protein